MPLSSVPASRACAHCISCARRGSRCGCSRRRPGSAALVLNRYPGARCDVESVDYCYSFSENYSRSGTGAKSTPRSRKSCATSTTSPTDSTCAGTSRSGPGSSAVLDEQRCAGVTTDTGERGRSVLRDGHRRAVSGDTRTRRAENFGGELDHTSHWPHETSIHGRRVGVIGTGSSGIQSIPASRGRPRTLRLPAHPQLQRARGQHTADRRRLAEIKAGYPQRRRLSWPAAAAPAHRRSQDDHGFPPQDAAGVRKALAAGRRAVRQDLPGPDGRPGANDEASKFYEEKIRAVIDDPRSPTCWSPPTIRSARSESAPTAITFRRSTGPM